MTDEQIKSRAEKAVDNFCCGMQLMLSEGDREVAIQSIATQMRVVAGEITPAQAGDVVAGVMYCERCGKKCRCPYCNKF